MSIRPAGPAAPGLLQAQEHTPAVQQALAAAPGLPAAPAHPSSPLLEVQVAGERLQLLPERAVYLPQHHTLLVADAHIGKAQSFRRLGVPVPAGTTAATLQRLALAVARTGAQQVVFLGDLLHSARSAAPQTWSAVAQWRQQHAQLALTLVRGNHDLHAGDPPAEWRITSLSGPLHLGGLALAHHPDPVPGCYVLAGHTHPAVVLRGRGPGRLRLPCFHFGPQVGVLPAFGEFTGMHVMPLAPGDRVFALAGDEVRACPVPAGNGVAAASHPVTTTPDPPAAATVRTAAPAPPPSAPQTPPTGG